MKPLIAATLLAAAAGVQAADSPIVVNMTGEAGGTFSAAISHTINVPGSFEDVYSLMGYTGRSTVNGTLSTLILNANSPDIDISSVTLNGVGFSQTLRLYQGNPDGREIYALPATIFDSALSLTVRGTLVAGRNGSSVGTYSGNFRVTPMAAVPEPETYAMLGAGLLMVGFLARRRTQKSN